MFTLFRGLWNMFFSKVQYQLLILGLDDAGKTTFLEQLRHMFSGTLPPEELKLPPTVGLNIGKFEVGRSKFLIWDLGGQASLRVLWEKYFQETHAVLFILDSSDVARMEENLRELTKLLNDSALESAPVFVLANKQDLKQAMTVRTVANLLRLPDSVVMDDASLPKAQTLTSAPSSSSSSSSSSSASSSSSSSGTSALLSDRVVRMFPISALNGQGVKNVTDALMDVLPKSKRSMRLSERAI